MRDRLIEIIKSTPHGMKTLGDVLDSLYIENVMVMHLLENGVIVPPCKVGDVVYFVGRNNGKPMGAIDELVIVGIEKTEQGFNAKAKFKDSENVFKIMNFSIDNYGFFSTREEAEAKLKEGGEV